MPWKAAYEQVKNDAKTRCMDVKHILTIGQKYIVTNHWKNQHHRPIIIKYSFDKKAFFAPEPEI